MALLKPDVGTACTSLSPRSCCSLRCFQWRNRSQPAWAARQMFLEDKIGTLEVGKRADIAIWDRNFYTIATEQIKETKCLMTLLDGEVVYRSAEFK
jgi:hypothetical protein